MDEEILIDIVEAYFGSDQERNFFTTPVQPSISIFGKNVDAESIWYSKHEQKYYLHCGCKEFEGDLDILSLSDENQKRLAQDLLSIIRLNPDKTIPANLTLRTEDSGVTDAKV